MLPKKIIFFQILSSIFTELRRDQLTEKKLTFSFKSFRDKAKVAERKKSAFFRREEKRRENSKTEKDVCRAWEYDYIVFRSWDDVKHAKIYSIWLIYCFEL